MMPANATPHTAFDRRRCGGNRRVHAVYAVTAAALTLICSIPRAMADTSADAVDTAAVTRLLTEHKCYICHADHEAKAGPAYADVAARFRGTRDAVPVIAAEIRNGVRGGGPWHMPPHPEVSASEARTMARYIMSLDASRRPPR